VGELLPGMAYLVRRLLENTANESFLRASFTEHVPEDQLLLNPIARGEMLNQHASPEVEQLLTNGNPPAKEPVFRNEPLIDFSREEARRSMQQALEKIAGQFGRSYPPVIGGRPVNTRELLDSVDPCFSRRVVGRCGRATPAHAEQAIAAARAAFGSWKRTDAKTRPPHLVRAAH